jgi:hypothetical protein
MVIFWIKYGLKSGNKILFFNGKRRKERENKKNFPALFGN